MRMYFVRTDDLDGQFAKVTKLGNCVNSGSHDQGAFVTGDGKYLFFTSMRSGSLKIYWVNAKTIEDLRPR